MKLTRVFVAVFLALLLSLAAVLVLVVGGSWLRHRGGEGLDIRPGASTQTSVLNRMQPEELARRRGDTPGRDILLITVDTLRADHLSSYGYPRKTTPFIDRLAESGVRFTRAFAPISVTAPSHASILTSLYPIQHGILKNGLAMSRTFTTLPELLNASGYRTAAAVSTQSHFGPSNLDQGFDRYNQPRSFEKRLPYRPAERTASRALRQLNDVPDSKPLFMWVHFFDAHFPYTRRRSAAESLAFSNDRERQSWIRHVRNQRGVNLASRPGWQKAYRQYDAEIRHVDGVLKQFFRDFTRVRGDTPFTVLTADHGEGMGNHRYWAHDRNVYNEQVNVPLILNWPGRRERTRVVQTTVELTDITPTILRYAGVDTETLTSLRSRPFEGQPLQNLVSGGSEESFGHAFIQRRTYGGMSYLTWLRIAFLKATTDAINYPLEGRAATNYEAGERYALTDGDSKYFFQTALPDEYYDLRQDFYETENLLGNRSDVARRLGGQLKGIVESFRARDYPGGFPIDRNNRRKLESLGYVN